MRLHVGDRLCVHVAGGRTHCGHDPAPEMAPLVVAGSDRHRDVSVGPAGVCVCGDTGHVLCSAGHRPTEWSARAGASECVALGGDPERGCALGADGAIECWGGLDQLDAGRGANAVVVAGAHACARDDAGWRCWSGEPGPPARLRQLDGARMVVLAEAMVCGSFDDAVRCWALTGHRARVSAPSLELPGRFESIAAAGGRVWAVDAEGALHAAGAPWPRNMVGSAGDLSAVRGVRTVAAGSSELGSDVCVLDDRGLVRCWGLFSAMFDDVEDDALVPPGVPFAALDASGELCPFTHWHDPEGRPREP